MFQSNERETQQHVTTIGKQMKITGTLASDSNVIFDGTLEKGTIKIGGSLTVGIGALIKGEVDTQKLTVNGTIEGNVSVKEDLEIGTSGKITGDITVRGKLIITKGGILNGRCTMGHESNSDNEAPAPTRRPLAREKKELASE
ncbi:MAG: polymer-forming cytoskeletal protein [Candidatus Abawacabacteria bacterium]|nr:polymer-forming cytoskeletal protein [Candidatus Abawacabacteria bacterium]